MTALFSASLTALISCSTVLIDKHAAPMEDVQQLAVELNHAAECVAEGYVTWPDIRQMLKEYDIEVELL